MDFFENRCGSNYICFFSGCILCDEDMFGEDSDYEGGDFFGDSDDDK